MITKEVVTDQVTVDEYGNIMCREVTRIMEDGTELSHSYHRTSLAPGAALTGVDPMVRRIALAAWTPALVAAHIARVAAPISRMGVPR